MSKKQRKGKKSCGVCRVLGGIVKFFLAITGILFIVYFWNLDQKLLGWAYNSVNKVFDRKPTDIKF